MKERRSFHHLTDSDVQTFLDREENQNTERKTEKKYFVALLMESFSRLRTKIHNWKICHGPFLAMYPRILYIENYAQGLFL